MSLNKFFYFFVIMAFSISCSKNVNNNSTIDQKDLDLQVQETYKEGIESLESGDVLFAAKKFNEVEILFPQSIWAPK